MSGSSPCMLAVRLGPCRSPGWSRRCLLGDTPFYYSAPGFKDAHPHRAGGRMSLVPAGRCNLAWLLWGHLVIFSGCISKQTHPPCPLPGVAHAGSWHH